MDFFPDEGNQPLYPAFELLRASYESLTVSRASRRREVKPVRHAYDPDVTPQLPQHQSTQPRDPPAASKPSAHRAPVASAKGTSPRQTRPTSRAFPCSFPGCTAMVSAAQASEGAATCDLHAEPIDLAHSTSSVSSDAEEPPPQPRDDASASDSAEPTPKSKRRCRHTKSRLSDAPRPPDRPPDSPSSGSSGPFREPPSLYPDSPDAGGEEERTPTSPHPAESDKSPSQSPSSVDTVFENLTDRLARDTTPRGPPPIFPMLPLLFEPRNPVLASADPRIHCSPLLRVPPVHYLFTLSQPTPEEPPEVLELPPAESSPDLVEPCPTEPFGEPMQELGVGQPRIFQGLKEPSPLSAQDPAGTTVALHQDIRICHNDPIPGSLTVLPFDPKASVLAESFPGLVHFPDPGQQEPHGELPSPWGSSLLEGCPEQWLCTYVIDNP